MSVTDWQARVRGSHRSAIPARFALAAAALVSASGLGIATARAQSEPADGRDPGPRLAKAPTATVALAVHVGVRQPDTRATAPVLVALARRGAIAGPDAARRFAALAMGPAADMTAAQRATFTQLVASGHEAWQKVDNRAAATRLQAALKLVRGHPAAMPRHPELRDAQFKAWATLAQVQAAEGQGDAAEATLASLVRAFPTRELSRSIYPPKAHTLYWKVRRKVDKQGRGKLVVDVTDAATAVFIDGRYVGQGAQRASLPPGRHTVYASVGDVAAAREFELAAGQTITIQVDLALAPYLIAADGAVALQFADDAERAAREPGVAAVLARRARAFRTIVVGVGVAGGGARVVRGASYDAAGTLTSGGQIELRGAVSNDKPAGGLPDELANDLADALAAFLDRDEPDPRIRPWPDPLSSDALASAAGADLVNRPLTDASAGRPYRTWKWVALAGATAGLATGITYLVVNNRGQCSLQPPQTQCPTVNDTRNLGIGFTAAGAVFAAAGTYFWLRDRGDRRRARGARVSVQPARDTLSIAVSGSF